MVDEAVLNEFKERFWKARTLGLSQLTKDQGKEEFRLLAEFARENRLEAEALIANAALHELNEEYYEAARLASTAVEQPEIILKGLAFHLLGSVAYEKGEHGEAIEFCKQALAEPSYDTPGNAWHNMGNAYIGKGDHDKAIDCFQKAVDEPSYDTPGSAWYNMGFVYVEKGDHDKAIECYQKALDEPSYDASGKAWNNIGVTYYIKGDYDKAIEYYEKALAEPSFDTPGQALNNMGNAYYLMGEQDKAIEHYQKALDENAYDTPSDAWNNLGLAYSKKGESGKAIEAWEKAVDAYGEMGNEEKVSYLKAKIAALKVPAEDRSEQDQALVESQPEKSITGGGTTVEAIEQRMKIKQATEKRSKWENYKEKGKKPSEHTDVLAILKGWGSSIPLIEGGEAACRGGGYFLKWQGRGMVVDPGFGFVKNFHDEGFHASEINAVVVSHNHSDHNYDLKAIDDIAYELRNLDERDDVRGYALLCDQDTKGAHNWISEIKRHRQRMPCFDLDRRELDMEKHIDLHGASNIPFRVGYLRAIHGQDVPNAVSLRVKCLDSDDETDVTIGFSCDTEYHDGLCDQEALGGCTILVAHVSEPDKAEFDNVDHVKQGHLGYRGVQQLVDKCKPELTIVCEFWAGLADLRIDLVQALRKRCNTKAILPGGVGLYVKPKTQEVRCSTCKEWVPHNDISVAGPSEPFGPLNYLCPECCL